MRKIDVLNFITDFRKSPNNIKSYQDILVHIGPVHESQLKEMLLELQKTRVIKETELDGERAFQVISR